MVLIFVKIDFQAKINILFKIIQEIADSLQKTVEEETKCFLYHCERDTFAVLARFQTRVTFENFISKLIESGTWKGECEDKVHSKR